MLQKFGVELRTYQRFSQPWYVGAAFVVIFVTTAVPEVRNRNGYCNTGRRVQQEEAKSGAEEEEER